MPILGCFLYEIPLLYRKKNTRSAFICFYCQWVGEEAEGRESGSRDADFDCVLLSCGGGGRSLRVDMCWWGGAKIV